MAGLPYCFVKTSSRSAKDTALFQSQFRASFHKYLQEARENGTEPAGAKISENTKVQAMIRAGTDSLRMADSNAVLDTFLRRFEKTLLLCFVDVFGPRVGGWAGRPSLLLTLPPLSSAPRTGLTKLRPASVVCLELIFFFLRRSDSDPASPLSKPPHFPSLTNPLAASESCRTCS